ncbi:oligosaccharide flippase family protein [candidate division WOR-3 bacterium]|uniref:Oligosaccharide flippase family protein n=1 Tax=candidate division WOR-3 bacterium TaxID=2052148 RepID=A0A9D5KA97_UNCW3|nr:oligosaccharide flippase family protein [candidate division WOR-3 bacterium]MBD3364146.1 oligosaccharide flippase family protein [candidate division WOR-3 bacterium]
MKLTDLKLLSKDTIIYGIGRSSTQAVQILLMPLYAAYLPADEFGVRALTMAIYGVLQIVSLWALDQAVLADYYKVSSLKERRKVVSTGFTLGVIMSLFWGAVSFAFASFLPQILAVFGQVPGDGIWGLELNQAASILKLFSLYAAFTPPVMIFLSYLRSAKRPIAYSIYTLVTALLRVGLMILALVVFKRGLKGLYEVDAILAVCTFPVLVILVYTQTKGIKFSFTTLRSMLKYALPIIPTAAFGWLRNLGDRFLINLFLTEREVGIYSYALNFPKVINFLLIVPLGLAWAPYLFSIKDRPDLPRIISRVLTYFLFAAGFALVLLGGTSSEILRIIAKLPEYWEGAHLVPLLVLGMCVGGACNVLGTVIAIKRKTVYFTITTLVSAAVAVLLNVTLLPVLGLWASAIALFASYTAMLAATLLLTGRLITIPFEKRRILVIAVTALTLTPVLSWWHFSSPITGLVVKTVVGTLCYAGHLLSLGFLLPEEKAVITSRLRNLIKRGRRKR